MSVFLYSSNNINSFKLKVHLYRYLLIRLRSININKCVFDIFNESINFNFMRLANNS